MVKKENKTKNLESLFQKGSETNICGPNKRANFKRFLRIFLLYYIMMRFIQVNSLDIASNKQNKNATSQSSNKKQGYFRKMNSSQTSTRGVNYTRVINRDKLKLENIVKIRSRIN